MSLLLKQINKSALDQDRLASHVLENTQIVFEGFSTASLTLICESASNYIGQVIQQLQQKQLKNPEQAVDMLAGLRVLGSAQSREAFNIKLPTFKVLTIGAGDNQNVNGTLAKLARNPSVKTIRGQIEQLINNAVKGDAAAIKAAVANLQTLQTGYERVQTKLQNAPEQQQADTSKPTAKPVQNQAATNQPAQKQTAPAA